MSGRRRRQSPVCLQRTFVILAMAAAASVLVLEVAVVRDWRPSEQRPNYVLQKTYVAPACRGKRLGNAMFLYAAAVGLAGRLNASVMVERSCPVASVFRISAELVADLERSLPVHVRHEEFGRRASAYDVGVRRLGRANTLLVGYFQSWMYFDEARSAVVGEYSFRAETAAAAGRFLAGRLPADWRGRHFVRVGVHVRRGDLLEDRYRNYGYTTADRAYFVRAMDHFRRTYPLLQFVVCSDDIGWAKENIRGDDVVYSEGHQDHEDMAILSLCNHTIISVGSFGWWAAWLANGTTIYYDNWPKEYSKLEYHVNKKTYFPPHWIPMR